MDSRVKIYIEIFAVKFTLRHLQPDINPLFATGVVDTGGKFAAGGIVDTGGKFATGNNNTSETGGKLAAGVVDTGGNATGGQP